MRSIFYIWDVVPSSFLVWLNIFCVVLCSVMVGRGIDVVRNKIKMFAQKKVTLPPGRHKVVILDEADRLSAAKFVAFT